MFSIALNNGMSMPVLGLGTWLSKPGEVGKAVEFALKNGYTLLDCAQVYGNQKEIGEALQKVYAETDIKREDIFITSKVWSTCHSFNSALKAFDEILEQLKTSYLDLCLIHWPMGLKEGGEFFPKQGNKILFSDVDYLETWKALETKVKEGKVRSIGLSNFNIEQMIRVIDNCEIKPAVLQVEFHPYFQQNELMKFCDFHSIVLTAYSPLGNPTMPFRKDGDPNILHDSKLTQLSKKYNKTNAQIALKALIQLNVAVIPKSVNESRIIENADLWDFSLTNEEILEIKSLDKNLRLLDLKPDFGDHPYFPW